MWHYYVITAVSVVAIAMLAHRFSSDSSADLGSGAMFDRIAYFYDSANNAMSLGFHLYWKYELTQYMDIGIKDMILDIATGSGDIAIQMGHMIKNNPMYNSNAPTEGSKQPHIIGLDPSVNMLAVAQDKVNRSGLEDIILLQTGTAEDLSAYKGQGVIYNKVTISFGIRNFQNRTLSLSQIRGIMPLEDPTAKIGILEFVAPRTGPLATPARLYLTYILPLISNIITMGSALHEYQHLTDSIMNFPSPTHFTDMMTSAGFNNCKHKDVFFDIVFLFTCDCSSAYSSSEEKINDNQHEDIRMQESEGESIVQDSTM